MKLCLCCVLLCAYLLVYIDAPEVIDEKAILATSVSFVQHGAFDMDEIAAGNDQVSSAGQLGTRGVDGALYAKKGPVTSIALLPLVFLAEKLPWLSVQATAMLFNALVTALTAVILFGVVLEFGYQKRTAFVVALIFGLGTLAFAYTSTLFGEPLSGLFILCATFFAYRFRQSGRMRDSLICGAMLALAIGSNAIYAALLPLAALALCWKKPIRALLWFGLPLLCCAALLALFNLLRFGSPLDTGYHFGQGEGFTYPFLTGFVALLVSPYRGIFWYSPVLLLAIPGWVMLRKTSARSAEFAWISLATVAAQVALFASWWAWDGGLGWGPRFLIPALPLMALWLAPLVEAAWTRLWLAVTVVAFALLSIAMQLLGALYSVFTYAYYATTYHPAIINQSTSSLGDLFTLSASPIVTNAALALAGREMVPVWL
ncbi:MAG TPA: hypothetical protein VKQ72_14270, partial [Aggregatilineales bacterium]|nr:hypothetical protein [Aggregatilineales bacterium]